MSDDPKLARLSTDEIIMLHIHRAITLEDQEYLKQLGMEMVRRRRASAPGNVILLSDPQRKFRTPRSKAR